MSDEPADPQAPAALPPLPPYPSAQYGGGALPPPTPPIGVPPYQRPGAPYPGPEKYSANVPIQQLPVGHAFVPGKGWVRLATAGQRFGARLIDGLITFVVVAILGLGALIGLGLAHAADAAGGRVPIFTGAFLAVLSVALLIFLAFGFLYEVAFIATKGATPGKMIMKIKVVNEANCELIGWGPSLLRWLIPVAANMLCAVLQLVVYLSFLWDGDHRMQGWHDKVAKDLVIQTG